MVFVIRIGQPDRNTLVVNNGNMTGWSSIWSVERLTKHAVVGFV